MSWIKRMELAVEFIEANLNNKIVIDDVAAVASCSKYHFHRVFYSWFNVTFAEYVRKRKFTLAAIDVVNGRESIVGIALKYGYDSPNAFTRSFKKMHGVNPSEARASNTKLATYNRASFTAEHHGIENMKYKIVEKPAFDVLGKSKTFNFDEFAKNGQKFWKEYVASDEYKALCKNVNGRPGEVTGSPLLTVYFPNKEDEQEEFVDVLGIESFEGFKAEAFEVHSVPSATYAEFECTYRTSMKTNRYIYGEWFEATGYERDGQKPDVVAYFPMPFRHFSEMGVRWWIPVIKK